MSTLVRTLVDRVTGRCWVDEANPQTHNREVRESRIRALGASGRVRLTMKARTELAGLDIGLDRLDAYDIVANLSTGDFASRFTSKATGEIMYVFKPIVAGMVLYVKIVLRDECVVISFHEQGEDGDATSSEDR
jgi:hypothetical protein